MNEFHDFLIGFNELTSIPDALSPIDSPSSMILSHSELLKALVIQWGSIRGFILFKRWTDQPYD